MDVRRTMLMPVALLAGLHAKRQAKAFLRAADRARKTQEDLLARLLAAHAETAFGRDHGFGSIRSYEQFISRVPVGSYETLRPYVRRVLAGEAAALLPPGEPVVMFSMTSGTTGEPKHIPVTGRFAREMRRGWNIFGSMALSDHREAYLRPVLQISSPKHQADSPTGLPCGAISGLLAETQKRIVRWMYVVPPAVQAVADPPARYYTTLRCGVGRDVSMIVTANPSSTIKMMETGQEHAERLIRDVADGSLRPPGQIGPGIVESLRFRPDRALAKRLEAGIRRDGQLRPRHFWNVALLCNWTGGTLKLYLRRLRELFDGVPIRDIGLLASEGRLSIPTADDTAAGAAEVTGNFLEFIPAAEAGAADPPTLRAHELEVAAEYFVVVSNWAGLWRYNIDDRIRVVGRLGECPVFEFLSRGAHTASITGEKLTEDQVVEAMRLACRQAGARVERFVVQGRFARTPYYELRMEAEGGVPLDGLAQLLDEALAALNMEYASKRASGRLGPIRAVALPSGWAERSEEDKIRQRSGRSEQYKHQYLLAEVIRDEEP